MSIDQVVGLTDSFTEFALIGYNPKGLLEQTCLHRDDQNLLVKVIISAPN